jgi:prepilin-type N-terminal cleavage/methylation domain-containing protein
MQTKKGFTLLELLVVVAIIGLLAAVVIGVLGSAKKKGEDSAIKEQMSALRSQAELYANANGGYNNMFTSNNTWASTDTAIQAILTYLDQRSQTHTAGSSSNAWAVQVQLKQNTAQYACIDSTAKLSVTGTVMAAGATVCP